MKKRTGALPFLLIAPCLLVLCLVFLAPPFSPPALGDKNGYLRAEGVGEENTPGEEALPAWVPKYPALPAESTDNKTAGDNTVGKNQEPEEISQETKEESEMYETLLEVLSFLQSPLPGAKITTRDSQLPGAPRPYRHGTHEGLDYYNGFCGIPINFGDPVQAAGTGLIERIDHAYEELNFSEREEMLRISAEDGDTPEDILDMLRGRQVWIAHPSGVVTRYAHLSQVSEELQTGDLVAAGDFIGSIGNSGTSDGVKGNTANAHLHFEIWLPEGAYLGTKLSPAEIRKILQKILE